MPSGELGEPMGTDQIVTMLLTFKVLFIYLMCVWAHVEDYLSGVLSTNWLIKPFLKYKAHHHFLKHSLNFLPQPNLLLIGFWLVVLKWFKGHYLISV